ncbi:SRPBCC family protein [Undibacterium sp. JH2W]|uniref:SRPBCC family protein n=1 Tax=Undibacterium sp. JH2W TaxID=3413037 RepID=UPI003BF0EEA8
MSHYQQSLVIGADPATVYAALATPEGLRGWWTQDCDVAVALGGSSHFRFGPHHKSMLVERLEPGREVRWLCVEAHIAVDRLVRKDEWLGTHLVFRLTQDGAGRTRLDFEHVGLVPELECYAMCNDGWRYYLASLQQLLETGKGTPFELLAVAAA